MICLMRREVFHISIPFFIMLGSIVCGVLIGAFLFELDIMSSLTGRSTGTGLIWYMFLPGSIGLGYILSEGRMRYDIIFICLLISLLYIILLTYHSGLSPTLARVYSISERVSGAYLSWRSPGIQNGVAKSAGTVNMMILILAIGAMRKQCPTWFLLVGSVVAFIYHSIMSSRAGIGLLVLILLVYYSRPYHLLPRRIVYSGVIIIAVFLTLLMLGEVIAPLRDIQQFTRLGDSFRASILDNSDKDFFLRRPIKYLSRAVERWMKFPILGTGLAETTTGIFRSRGYHNDFLIVLAGGGIVGFLALICAIWRLFRLEAILILPFILPGLTNEFMAMVPVGTLYGVLVGYMIGTGWTPSRMLQESYMDEEVEELEEELEQVSVSAYS